MTSSRPYPVNARKPSLASTYSSSLSDWMARGMGLALNALENRSSERRSAFSSSIALGDFLFELFVGRLEFRGALADQLVEVLQAAR